MRAVILEKIAAEHSLSDIIGQPSIFKSLKADFLQSISRHAIWNVVGSAVQPLNPQCGPFDNPSELRAKFGGTVFQ